VAAMNQPDENDGPRDLPSIDDSRQKRFVGPELWQYALIVLFIVAVALVTLILLRPQLATNIFHNISNDI
jgi:hypothetical protein